MCAQRPSARRGWRGAPGRLAWLLVAFPLCAAPPAPAQNVYPVPRLTSLTPAGARRGTTVEVTVTGIDLEDVSALLCSRPQVRVESVPVPPPPAKAKTPPPPPPVRFRLSVPAEAPLGPCDVRVVGRWGVSNPRAFVIGDRDEVVEKEPNNDVPQAQAVPLGTTINGVISANTDVDYYRFAGKKGQHVVLHCATEIVDSRLNPLLQLFGPAGQELASEHSTHGRNAVLDRVLPQDGDYLVRVCAFAYVRGGPDHFYRLELSAAPWVDAAYPPVLEPGKPAVVTLYGRNLPGGQPATEFGRRGGRAPLQRLEVRLTLPAGSAAGGPVPFGDWLPARCAGLDAFEYRVPAPAGLSNPVLLMRAEAPVVLDNGDNDTPAKAQAITLPCELCGRIEKRRDRDWYAFTARKGEVWVLEGYADRLGAPADLYFRLRRAESGQELGEFDDHTEVPPVVGKFFTRTDDPKTRFVVPADGRYELMVSTRTADVVAGPRSVYRLTVRPERPDFRLVLVGNNDTGAGGCTLRQGGNQDLQVLCLRRDGFAGEIALAVEGLPAGVTCPPQVVGPNVRQSVLVLSAASDAKEWAGPLRVQGTAVIDGKPVVRAAQAGCLLWPTPQNIPSQSRLSRSLYLAVRPAGPFTLDAPVRALAVPVGGPASVKVRINRKAADFKSPVQLRRAAAPAQTNGQPLNLPQVNVGAGQAEGTVNFTVPRNVAAGDYALVFQGQANYAFVRDAKKKQRANLQVTAVSPSIRLTVYDRVADLAVTPARVSHPAGGASTLVVALKRLHGYKGDFRLELVPVKGAPGLTVSPVTVPAGGGEARLTFRSPANLKAGAPLSYLVRATARVGSVTLTQETPVEVAVLPPAPAPKVTQTGKPGKPAAPAAPSAGNVRVVPVLAEGSAGWRFLPAGQVQGDGWRMANFDDRAWRTGKAPLGNGEAEIGRRKGTEVAEKGQPFVFRHAFEVPADLLKQKGVSFVLRVASDDSAVVYLNGQPADQDPVADHEFQYWNRTVTVPAGLLRPGRNVVAVLVKNRAGSSDLYLDLALAAQVPR